MFHLHGQVDLNLMLNVFRNNAEALALPWPEPVISYRTLTGFMNDGMVEGEAVTTDVMGSSAWDKGGDGTK